MSFNERMIRTLQENLPIFAQQLFIPDVYQSFSEILANVKKNSKADALPHLEEFEAKIEEVLERFTLTSIDDVVCCSQFDSTTLQICRV